MPGSSSLVTDHGPNSRSENEDDGLAADDLLTVLSNERRRYLLKYLRDSSGEVTLSDASERIAAWENDVDPETVTYDQRKSVYTSLLQFHCPKMDDLGVVEFDRRRSTVALPDDDAAAGVAVDPLDGKLADAVTGSLLVGAGLVLGAWSLGVPPLDTARLGTVGVALATAGIVAALILLSLRETDCAVGITEAVYALEE